MRMRDPQQSQQKKAVPLLGWLVTDAQRTAVVSRSTAAHSHVAARSMTGALRSRRCHHCCSRQACLCQRSRRGSCAARRSSMPSAGAHACGLAAQRSDPRVYFWRCIC